MNREIPDHWVRSDIAIDQEQIKSQDEPLKFPEEWFSDETSSNAGDTA